jgi:hypothetical protein
MLSWIWKTQFFAVRAIFVMTTNLVGSSTVRKKSYCFSITLFDTMASTTSAVNDDSKMIADL